MIYLTRGFMFTFFCIHCWLFIIHQTCMRAGEANTIPFCYRSSWYLNIQAKEHTSDQVAELHLNVTSSARVRGKLQYWLSSVGSERLTARSLAIRADPPQTLSAPANQLPAATLVTNGVSGMPLRGAGVSVQQASPCLANNSLESATLLLKKRSSQEGDRAELIREENRVWPIHETLVSRYQKIITADFLLFETSQVVSKPFRLYP